VVDQVKFYSGDQFLVVTIPHGIVFVVLGLLGFQEIYDTSCLGVLIMRKLREPQLTAKMKNQVGTLSAALLN